MMANFHLPIVLSVFLGSLLSIASAQGPLILREYQFLPQRSTLHVEGGFAYVNVDLDVSGNIGLATGIESNTTQLDPFAQFVFVDAVASDGLWELDLDWALNLTGLDGTFEVTHPQDLFFKGFEAQGQPMSVEARLHGKHLHLLGSNRASCCDMYDYTLNALAVQVPPAELFGDKDNSAMLGGNAVPEPCGWLSILLALATFLVATRRAERVTASRVA